MEKIAFKNTQQGAPNTYELETREFRQLIASGSVFDEIKEFETQELTLTSQRWSGYDMPISILVSEVILYFFDANRQNMKLVLGGGSIDENFIAPNGYGAVRIPIADVTINAGDTQRMIVANRETTTITPQPILRSWSIVYKFVE